MPQTDLFMSKKQLLYEYIKQKKYIKTHEVIAWGLDHFCNRAERYARELAQEGKIKRMPDSKKKFYFSGVKEDIWEIMDWFNPSNIGL